MIGLPNLKSIYTHSTDPVKDLMAVALGLGTLRLVSFGVLRVAGIKWEVAQLPAKSFAFPGLIAGAATTINRELLLFTAREIISPLRSEGPLDADRHANNKECSFQLFLAAFAAATVAITQHSKVSRYLPPFTQLSRKQIIVLSGSAITSMLILRYLDGRNE